MFAARFPNWLPVPAPVTARISKEPEVSENDMFPKGTVAKFFPNQDYGFIQDQHGRDVYFHLNELDLVGPKDKYYVKVGARVGYDLCWTSHGQHVKRMKIY